MGRQSSLTKHGKRVNGNTSFLWKEKKDRVYGAGSRLLETREATFSYDDEGNLIQKVENNGDTWKYEYNGNGMMSKVIKPDKTAVTFKYESLGRRIEKCSDEKTTSFVWDGNTILHEYFSENNSDIFENLEGYSSNNKSEISDNLVTWVFNDGFVPSAKITNEGIYSIISDYLGTPVEAYGEQGNRVWSAELDIYGRVNEFTGEKDFIPFRYQGQYEDVEIGLYYNRFRYYSPSEGMYTQPDPIGLSGGIKLYNYVYDPNIWIDPFGLAKQRGPKTGGKGPHNEMIYSWDDEIVAANGTVTSGGRGKERLIKTPNGKKTGRRPDIEWIDADGNQNWGNVGKTKKDGSPIKREQEALDDLNKVRQSHGVNSDVEFRSYNHPEHNLKNVGCH
ncbi:RHS repeat domain-containing protein [Lysinibacillus xylanilyticus]|uniref:RHS repeat domain-containing protein n=1 Tax=Lysinibacillus xylanilyticus TaxID=582475 RepID=UPI003CFBC524